MYRIYILKVAFGNHFDKVEWQKMKDNYKDRTDKSDIPGVGLPVTCSMGPRCKVHIVSMT